MNITVAGVGYVGLSIATMLAQQHQVSAVCLNATAAHKVNCRISPIRDRQIQQFFDEEKQGLRKLQLQVTTDKQKAYTGAQMVFVAVPTDYDEQRNVFDTSAVEDVIQCVLRYCPDATVVIKSTVPVGYTEDARQRYGMSNLFFSPEFLREGSALYDSLYPSRIIVGAPAQQQEQARQICQMLAQCAEKQETPALVMPLCEAEAVKLFSNTYLAMRVSYFNELDTYAHKKGLDAKSILDGVGLDPRIGGHYNNPSFGYGGYCLPKDTRQLLSNYNDVPQNLIGAIVTSNDTRKRYIAQCILEEKPRSVGIYRLTMKGGSDNFRASAILDIMQQLQAAGVELLIYEPTLPDGSSFAGGRVVNDLDAFLESSQKILANRYDPLLQPAADKLFTRDVYFRD